MIEAADEPDLTRKGAATFLTKLGFPISEKTLTNLAAGKMKRGQGAGPDAVGVKKGPPFYKMLWGPVRYRKDDLIAWVADKVVRVE